MLAKTWIWAVVVVIVGAGCLGGGYLLGHASVGSSTSAAENSTLSILGAGTLNPTFPRLASLFVNETPGVSAPVASQVYEGSLDVVNAITSTKTLTKVDVAALADFRLAPEDLEPTYAAYEVAFGMTPEVLCYNTSIPGFAGINSSNWGWKLPAAVNASGTPLGVWNASTDPNGYNEIFSMELQGLAQNSSSSVVYDDFYTTDHTGLAAPISGKAIFEHESTAAKLLSTGVVSAVITYRSYAIANHLTYVNFSSIVGLDNTTAPALTDYAALSTEILSSSGSPVAVHAAPVIFAVTVPLDAPNPALGEAFIHLLESPAGAAILSAGGAFTPIFPGWFAPATGAPTTPPSVIAPDVVPMPGWATALLT